MASSDGVEVHGPARERYRGRPERRGARAGGRAPAGAGPDPGGAAGQAGRAPGQLRRRRAARLPPGHGAGARRRLAGRAGGQDRRPAGRDHRPDRPQDADQRPQLRGQGVHGRLRGRQRPHLGEHVRRPAEPGRRHRGHDQLREPRRAPVPAERGDRDPDAAAAGLAPAREAHHRGRPAGLGQPDRLRAVHVRWGQAAAGAGQGGLPLPAQAGEPPGGAALERRLRAGLRPPRHPAGHGQGDGADRDHHGRLRDGRDPLRAARPLGRAERRPLGLHVLGHQEVPEPARVHPARPQQGHHDGAVHARLHPAAGQDLPPPGGVRHGRHVGVHPQPQTARDQRPGRGQGARGQAA